MDLRKCFPILILRMAKRASGKGIPIYTREIVRLREVADLSQESLAQKVGVSKATATRWESKPIIWMHQNNAERLAGALGVALDVFLSAARASREDAAAAKKLAAETIMKNKQPSGLNMSTFTTGRPVEHFHGVDAARSTQREPINREAIMAPRGGAGTFFVTVDGDCMEPEFQHGAIVLFSEPEALRGLVSGEPYFIRFKDGETTFKSVVIPTDTREELILHPTNPKYPDRRIMRDEISMIALAIGTHKPRRH